MKLINNPDRSQWAEILKRPVMNTENLFDTVRGIIDRVKSDGDRAVLEMEAKFDKAELTSLAVTEAELKEAETLVDEKLKAAIRLAKQNIETFHAAQRFEGKKVETMPGVTCWQKAVAIEGRWRTGYCFDGLWNGKRAESLQDIWSGKPVCDGSETVGQSA